MWTKHRPVRDATVRTWDDLPWAEQKLAALNVAFTRQQLPAGLDLALTGGSGPSIAALVGLTAQANGVQLPLASWGAGTRRLAALAIAEQTQNATPITIVDEVERGLEPYRQRTLSHRNASIFICASSIDANQCTFKHLRGASVERFDGDVVGRLAPPPEVDFPIKPKKGGPSLPAATAS